MKERITKAMFGQSSVENVEMSQQPVSLFSKPRFESRGSENKHDRKNQFLDGTALALFQLPSD